MRAGRKPKARSGVPTFLLDTDDGRLAFDADGNGPGVPGTYQSQEGSSQFSGNFATNVSSTAVARPAETVILSDGETMIHQDAAGGVPTFVLYTFPGGGDKLHNDGGNYAFVDGHSKRIARNPLNYVTLSGGGYYYMTYFTMSE